MELTAGECDAQFSEEGKEWRFPKAQAEEREEEEKDDEDDDDDDEEEEAEKEAPEEEAQNAGQAGKNSQKTAYRD